MVQYEYAQEPWHREEKEGTTPNAAMVVRHEQSTSFRRTIVRSRKPANSGIWRDSPLRFHCQLKDFVHFIFDQCQHGLVDEFYTPVRKSIRIDSNFKMLCTNALCEGHVDANGKEIKRSTLEGIDSDGVARTAKAAVYTHILCRSLVADILV